VKGVELIVLRPAEVLEAARRYEFFGNSAADIMREYLERGILSGARRTWALHLLERKFGIDLGALCSKFLAKEGGAVSALERGVMEYLAGWRILNLRGGRKRRLVIDVARVRRLNALAEGMASAAHPEGLAEIARALTPRWSPS